MKEVVWYFTYIKEKTSRENYKEIYKLWRLYQENLEHHT